MEPTGKPARKTSPFIYPKLPRYESLIYLAIVVGFLVYGYIQCYYSSENYLKRGRRRGTLSKSWMSNNFRRLQDTGNWEWYNWVHHYAPRMGLCLIGHALLFNLSEQFLNGNIWKSVNLIYWMLCFAYIGSPKLLLFILIEQIVVYSLARMLNHSLVPWFIVGFFIWSYTNKYRELLGVFGSFNVSNPLAEILMYTYKQPQIISYCVELILTDKKKRPRFLPGYLELLWYSFYLPYTASIVRIYPFFKNEMEQRNQKSKNFSQIIKIGCRLIIVFCFIEVCLHFLYVNSMLTDPGFLLRGTRLDAMIAIGWAAGQFFYLKYYIIFGLCTIFARIDRMCPPPPPICMARVSLYSKQWRRFDAGIYDFFKTYIFLAIARPTFSIPRKLLGLGVSYLFVTCWHGFTRQYIIWIAWNLMEILTEMISKGVYVVFLKNWREKYISNTIFRRILALLQIFPLAMGPYSSFYFLGGAATGDAYMDRLFKPHTFPPTYVCQILFVFGYCFNNVAMDAEIWESQYEQQAPENDKEIAKKKRK